MSRQCSDLIVLLWAKPFAYPNGFFPTENRTKKHCHKLFDSHAKIDCLWMIYYWNNNRKGQNTRIYFEQKQLVHVIYINDFKYFSLHFFYTLLSTSGQSWDFFWRFFSHILNGSYNLNGSFVALQKWHVYALHANDCMFEIIFVNKTHILF